MYIRVIHKVFNPYGMEGTTISWFRHCLTHERMEWWQGDHEVGKKKNQTRRGDPLSPLAKNESSSSIFFNKSIMTTLGETWPGEGELKKEFKDILAKKPPVSASIVNSVTKIALKYEKVSALPFCCLLTFASTRNKSFNKSKDSLRKLVQNINYQVFIFSIQL